MLRQSSMRTLGLVFLLLLGAPLPPAVRAEVSLAASAECPAEAKTTDKSNLYWLSSSIDEAVDATLLLDADENLALATYCVLPVAEEEPGVELEFGHYPATIIVTSGDLQVVNTMAYPDAAVSLVFVSRKAGDGPPEPLAVEKSTTLSTGDVLVVVNSLITIKALNGASAQFGSFGFEQDDEGPGGCTASCKPVPVRTP